MAGRRDPGYPAFLAVTFAFGGGLETVVRMQQAAWAVLMLALAATAQAATRNAAALVPLILVAAYPGLLLFRNVLTAELLFAVFLNLAMAGLLVATCVGKAARCWLVGASVLCAALAACFRSRGVLVPSAAVLVGASLARPDTSARLAVIAVSVAAALALLAAGSRFGASNSDEDSVVFVPKTLFCNHLDIVLARDAARREIVSAAGARADVTMARLAADFATEPGRWPVLGFFGDACLFDTALDRDVADDTGNAVGAAAAYRRIFLAAVRDRPLAYAGKFVRQMAYGVSVAWPPYGLDPAIPVSTDDVPHVSDIIQPCSQYLRERCDHSRPEENDYPANLRRTQIRQPSNPKRYDAPNHMEARRLALEDFQRRGRRRAVQRAASAGLQDTPGKPRQRTDSHAPQSAGASRAAPTKRAVS